MFYRLFFRRWVLLLFLCFLTVPCVADSDITVLTSFTLTLKPGHTVGDIAYSPTSDTLLIVPFEYICEGDPPYYREYSTSGTLIQTVDLPYAPMGDPDNLVDSPINGIEVDWVDNSIWLSQVGMARTGSIPPDYPAYVFQRINTQEIEYKFCRWSEETWGATIVPLH